MTIRATVDDFLACGCADLFGLFSKDTFFEPGIDGIVQTRPREGGPYQIAAVSRLSKRGEAIASELRVELVEGKS